MVKDASYGDLAYIYDLLTDDVEYEKRADYIAELINRHFPKKAELLCDLGCGTGTLCSILSDKGYNCIGIDNSPNMLSVAFEKYPDQNILFLNQDICEFELYGTVDVFTAMLDTLNYITEPQFFANLMSLVHNYLNHNGIFIFDINTKNKFEKVLGDNVYVFEKGNVFYTWENYYEDELLDMYLNFFISDKNGKYKRFTEQHQQRYYSRDFIANCADACGLSLEAVYGDLKHTSPDDNDERAFYVLKKH